MGTGALGDIRTQQDKYSKKVLYILELILREDLKIVKSRCLWNL
jgi:hypothetical protein